MALNKVNYVDNETIITAQNLNDIQNEIILNQEDFLTYQSQVRNNFSNLENTINDLENTIDNIQEPWTNQQNLLAGGDISKTTTITYTATQNCIAYISPWIQANNSGGIEIQINGIKIIDMASSGEELANYIFCFPIFLQNGDILKIHQVSNKIGTYKIFGLKN